MINIHKNSKIRYLVVFLLYLKFLMQKKQKLLITLNANECFLHSIPSKFFLIETTVN